MTTEAKMIAEAEIQALHEGWAEAFRAKDLDRIMSVYAEDVVAFDLVPPLRYLGADAFRKVWAETFEFFQGSIDYEVRDREITVSDDLAILHSVNRLKGILPSGERAEYWHRWTGSLRRNDGRWRVTHEHVSLPTNLVTGKSSMDLTPYRTG